MITLVEARERRATVRRVAAALAGVTALIYLLIGLQVVTVISVPADQPSFGLPAAAAFGILAVLLLLVDWRPLWALAALFVAMVVVMYVAVSPIRVPPFEAWGVLLRFVQLPLAAVLGWLAATRHEPSIIR